VRLADAAVSLGERAVSLAPADPAGREARALAWFARGRAVLNADQDEALAYFERARAHFSCASARDTVSPREAGLIELFTSDVFIKRGDKERGPAHARESLRIAQQILAARPTDPVARQDVAAAAGQLAAGLVNMGQEAEAFTYFTLSTDMREQIVAADPDNVRARERLALAKGRFGTMLARAGNLPAARVALERSVELYEDLHATGRLAATMEADFAEVLGHMGDYQQRTGNARGACASFRRATDILLAANARVPLTALRKQLLDFNLEELEQCP
jgi:tetratricopeptide (TPR) repeat protein